MRYFEEFTKYLEEHDIELPVGSTEDEIAGLEKDLGCVLPNAYREFLLLMGRDYEGVMVGTSCFLSDIKSNNEYLPELLAENNLSEFLLPEKYVAFFCHQGYMMAWFAVPNDKDDPICTFYFEGTTEKPKEYGSFSEFMNKDIMGNAKSRFENRYYEKSRRKWWQLWK